MNDRNEPIDDSFIGSASFILRGVARPKKPKVSKGSGAGGVGQGVERGRAGTISRIRRIVQRKPEVMVKVSGGARGRKHIGEHLAYTTRNGKLEAERENGEIILGAAAVKEVAGEWWQLRGAEPERNKRHTINVVLSMPAGTDREAFAAAASTFARTEFGGRHDYLIVHHADTEHPHAHLTIRNVGFDGQCLNPRKPDLQRWREGLARALRDRGIEAEATPRRARGVTRKGTRQAIKHMDKRKASTVTRWKIQHALKTVAAGEANQVPEWEKASQQRQVQIKAAWNTVARALDESGNIALAVQVRAFVSNMQSAPTERQVLVAQAQAAIARAEAQRERQRDQERRR
jgi:type IV secretory pathway VirD2 relaxase